MVGDCVVFDIAFGCMFGFAVTKTDSKWETLWMNWFCKFDFIKSEFGYIYVKGDEQ